MCVCVCVTIQKTFELNNLWLDIWYAFGSSWHYLVKFEIQVCRWKFKVTGRKCAKVVGATSSESFLVVVIINSHVWQHSRDHTYVTYYFYSNKIIYLKLQIWLTGWNFASVSGEKWNNGLLKVQSVMKCITVSTYSSRVTSCILTLMSLSLVRLYSA